MDKRALREELIAKLQPTPVDAIARIRAALRAIGARERGGCACPCARALGTWTREEAMAPETRRRLAPLLAKELPP